MLLLAALLCVPMAASGSRLDCRCGDTVCSCLVVRPRPGDQLCAHTSRGSFCSPLGPRDADSRLVRLLMGADTIANPECKCGRRFCACIVVTSSVEDRICLNSIHGLFCHSVQKATESYGLLSPLTKKGVESHDNCRCSGAACSCNWSSLRPDSVVCLHSAERLSCVQLVMDNNDNESLTFHDSFHADCLCLVEFCVCIGMQPTKHYQLCLHSSNDTVCHPLQITNSSSSLQSEERVSCVCGDSDGDVDGPCRCSWPRLRPGHVVCLRSAAGVTCVPARVRQDVSARSDVEFDDTCSCHRVSCHCQWRRVGPDDEVCSFSRGAIFCGLVSVRVHPFNATGGALRRRRSVPQWLQNCVCDGGVCTCDWLKERSIDGVCITQQEKETCFEVKYSSNPRHRGVKGLGCVCSGTQCTCRFGGDVKGAKICVKAAEGTSCTAARPQERNEQPEDQGDDTG